MMISNPVGPMLHMFLVDHLQVQRGLRPPSVKSYRDALRLFVIFVAADVRRKITRLSLNDLTYDRVRCFMSYLEKDRRNQASTRNQRLVVLHRFFAFVATRVPEMLATSERVQAIPLRRVQPPETHFLERDEIAGILRGIKPAHHNAQRDRALLLFLYNTGARAQEVADLCLEHLQLGNQPRVRLHGKGDKWRVCPLWAQTANLLAELLRNRSAQPTDHVFTSRRGQGLTRSGIYKIVRRNTDKIHGGQRGHVGPHVLRHTTAVHLLESGVDVNVIRGWLGHVSLDTTNRYAELTMRTKEAALRACEPPTNETFPKRPIWRDDENLLSWLNSL